MSVWVEDTPLGKRLEGPEADFSNRRARVQGVKNLSVNCTGHSALTPQEAIDYARELIECAQAIWEFESNIEKDKE